MLEIKEREYELIKKLCQNKANIYIWCWILCSKIYFRIREK